MNNKLLLIWLLILNAVPFLGLSQQRPQYSQYMVNNYLLNPAITGIENYVAIKLANRTQWTTIEGAPTTFYLSAHTKIAGSKERVKADGNKIPAFGAARHKRSIYRAADARPQHGIGLIVLHDKLGPFSRTDLKLSYAYHQPITDQLKFAAGIATGASQLSLNGNELQFANPADATSAGWNAFKPNLDIGLWLYSDRFYAGASATELVNSSFTFGDEAADAAPLYQHYFFTAAYKLASVNKIDFIPAMMVKIVRPLPVSVDYNLRAVYDQKVWAGVSYRQQDSFAALAGFALNNTFDVSYTYDAGVSTLEGTSHEVMVGVRLQRKFEVQCPRSMW